MPKLQLTQKALDLYKRLDAEQSSHFLKEGTLVPGKDAVVFGELIRKKVAKNVGKGKGQPTYAYLIVKAADIDSTPRGSPQKSSPTTKGLTTDDIRKVLDQYDTVKQNAISKAAVEKKQMLVDYQTEVAKAKVDDELEAVLKSEQARREDRERVEREYVTTALREYRSKLSPPLRAVIDLLS